MADSGEEGGADSATPMETEEPTAGKSDDSDKKARENIFRKDITRAPNQKSNNVTTRGSLQLVEENGEDENGESVCRRNKGLLCFSG